MNVSSDLPSVGCRWKYIPPDFIFTIVNRAGSIKNAFYLKLFAPVAYAGVNEEHHRSEFEITS